MAAAEEVDSTDLVADFGQASALERTVLMCMERIAELERRVDGFEEEQRRDRERNALVAEVMSMSSKPVALFIDVISSIVGPKWTWNPDTDDVIHVRAIELITIATKMKYEGMTCWYSFISSHKFEIADMINAMTTDELRGVVALWKRERAATIVRGTSSSVRSLLSDSSTRRLM
jgi:hypothetical protein